MGNDVPFEKINEQLGSCVLFSDKPSCTPCTCLKIYTHITKSRIASVTSARLVECFKLKTSQVSVQNLLISGFS
jgi:hypothetical protein